MGKSVTFSVRFLCFAGVRTPPEEQTRGQRRTTPGTRSQYNDSVASEVANAARARRSIALGDARITRAAVLAALCAFFLIAAVLFIPYAGFEDDETLFAGPLYTSGAFFVRMFHHNVPIMLMSYLGTLKTWIYAPILRFWAPNVWSVRVPAVLIGIATICVFYRLLLRVGRPRAALAGAALLATDPSFLLTDTFDWGPVALQHLTLTAALLLLLTAYQDASPKKIAFGFLFLGLGMWDKALFSWLLGGLVMATITVFPREFRRLFNRRNVALAVLGFVVGAAPLIIYNTRTRLATFRGNAKFSTEGFSGKALLLRLTLDGSGLFGWLVNDEQADHPNAPATTIERLSVTVREHLGQHRSNLFVAALVTAALLAPLWWKRQRRAMLFAMIAMVVAWLQMAFTKDAGGAVHHAVLLWPLPHFAVAVAFAEASLSIRRYSAAVLSGAIIVLCAANLLVINQYFSQFVRFGPALIWSDAMGPLSASFDDAAGQNIYVTDWGIMDQLIMLHQGRLHVWVGTEPMNDPTLTDRGRQMLQFWMSRPNPVFVGHTKPYEVLQGTYDRLETYMGEIGYRKQVVRTIPDSHGRQIFEIDRFVPR